MELRDLCQVKDLMAATVTLEASLRERTGLNLNQSFVLCCLAQRQLSAGTLAEELRIHGASLSRIVKVLEHKGLLSRGRDSADSRVTVLTLTGEGRSLAAALSHHEQSLFPWVVEEPTTGFRKS
jgi:DNA-binding MarR family transcriptional regulator